MSTRRTPPGRWRRPLTLLLVAVAALAGATSAGAPSAGAAAGAGAASVPRADYYLSIGDSYAAGYQPVSAALDHRDQHGFAYQVVGLAKARGYRLVLRNYGCDGATTSSILRQVGCSQPAAGPDVPSYPTQTQAAAANQFLSRHRGQVGLITVSIGGNDIIGCGRAAQPTACFTRALPAVRKNLAVLMAGLRRAAGPTVPIVGLTYPDVFLGLYTLKDPTDEEDAVTSVAAFGRLLNPTLQAVYAAADVVFDDVTRATGAYVPFGHTTSTKKYGTLPVAVADVCTLTYYCRIQDVHPTTPGYTSIAKLIVRALLRLSSPPGARSAQSAPALQAGTGTGPASIASRTVWSGPTNGLAVGAISKLASSLSVIAPPAGGR